MQVGLEIWNYINPADRYSQTLLQKYNLQYQTVFTGRAQAAVIVESMKIVNHSIMYGAFPYGNTKIQK